jgi:hypothetical protein
VISRRQDLPGYLLKRRAGHPHEALASGRGQFHAFGRNWHISLDEYVAIFSQDCCGTGTTTTQLGKGSILSDDFLDFHNFSYCSFFPTVKQNRGFCFIRDPEAGFV